MLNYILIGLGGAAGSITRFWASGLIANRFGKTFPWGTLFVNVTGSFIISAFATLTAPHGLWLVGVYGRNLFMTGFCGGYTTVSSFSLQTLNLAQDEEWLYAFNNAVFNLLLCLAAAWAGHSLVLKSSSVAAKGH